MRTAIVIPARLAATRLPDKPLAMIGNKPLIVRTCEQARKCRNADLVIVATDSSRIADAVRAHGGTAIMTRADHASGTDRVAEVARTLDAELIVNLQGDEPFIDPVDLETVVEGLELDVSELTTLATPMDSPDAFQSPNVVKVVRRDDNLALYFSRAAIPHPRQPAGELGGAWRHVGVYGYRREALLKLAGTPPHPLELCEGLEQLRALATGMRILVLPAKTLARGIDTAEDLAWAQARFDAQGEDAFP
jgi:3-deoxy-manno-octulosonate cytidylyltransferase (CMP-KDO synthetase)